MMKIIKRIFIIMLTVSIFITSIPNVAAVAIMEYKDNKTIITQGTGSTGGGVSKSCNGTRRYCGEYNSNGIKRTYTASYGYTLKAPEVTTVTVYDSSNVDIINSDMSIDEDKLPLAGTAVGMNIKENKKLIAALNRVTIEVSNQCELTTVEKATKYVCKYKPAISQKPGPMLKGDENTGTFHTLDKETCSANDVVVDTKDTKCPNVVGCEPYKKENGIGKPVEEKTTTTECVPKENRTIEIQLTNVIKKSELNYEFVPVTTKISKGTVYDEIDLLYIIEAIEHFAYKFYNNLAYNISIHKASYDISINNSNDINNPNGIVLLGDVANYNSVWKDMNGKILETWNRYGYCWKYGCEWQYNSGKIGEDDYEYSPLNVDNNDNVFYQYKKKEGTEHTYIKTAIVAGKETQSVEIELDADTYTVGGVTSVGSPKEYGKLYDARDIELYYKMNHACIDPKTGTVSYNKNCTNEFKISNDTVNSEEHWHYFIPLNAKSNQGIRVLMTPPEVDSNKVSKETCLNVIKDYYIIKNDSNQPTSTKAPYTNVIKPTNTSFFKGDYYCIDKCGTDQAVYNSQSSDYINIINNGGCYKSSVVEIPVKQLFYNETKETIKIDEDTEREIIKIKGFNFYYQPIDVNGGNLINTIFPNGVTTATLWDDWYKAQTEPAASDSKKTPDLIESFDEVTYAAQDISVVKVRNYGVNNTYTSWNNMNLNGTSKFISDEGIVKRYVDETSLYKLGCGPLNSTKTLKDKYGNTIDNILYVEECKQ